VRNPAKIPIRNANNSVICWSKLIGDKRKLLRYVADHPLDQKKRADLCYEHNIDPRSSTLHRKDKDHDKHGSASPRKQESRTLDANLKRRARKLATDSRVDPRTRSLIRYGLEIKDQYLEQVVKRVEAGEMSIDHLRWND
jgi:hypothetical protein